jgi:uncharacterized protein YsxB (DUF464 family)
MEFILTLVMEFILSLFVVRLNDDASDDGGVQSEKKLSAMLSACALRAKKNAALVCSSLTGVKLGCSTGLSKFETVQRLCMAVGFKWEEQQHFLALQFFVRAASQSCQAQAHCACKASSLSSHS